APAVEVHRQVIWTELDVERLAIVGRPHLVRQAEPGNQRTESRVASEDQPVVWVGATQGPQSRNRREEVTQPQSTQGEHRRPAEGDHRRSARRNSSWRITSRWASRTVAVSTRGMATVSWQ